MATGLPQFNSWKLEASTYTMRPYAMYKRHFFSVKVELHRWPVYCSMKGAEKDNET